MDFINFKGANERLNRFAASDKDQGIPTLDRHNDMGTKVCKVSLSKWERVRLLFSGSFWMIVNTYNEKHHPVEVQLDKPFK